MRVFKGIQELVTMSGAAKKDGRHIVEADLQIIRHAAIIEDRGVICWVGPESKLKSVLNSNLVSKNKSVIKNKSKAKVVNLNAECVIPAFLECHTHLVFAGDRKHEFELRNQGATYKQIAEQGGGIQFTVRQTRKCSEANLLKEAQRRSDRFLSQGVTTLEVKSGYGLTERDEMKILKVAQHIQNMRIVGTYLGPHAIPEGRTPQDYLDEVCEKTLPKIKKQKLAERVDMFVEGGYYSLQQAKQYYSKAQKLGFRLTGHVEQMSRLGGAEYLSSLSADSIDHLVEVNHDDILKIAKSDSTAVLLPTSDLYLKMNYPPARELLDRGARVALATDFNPGTSPTQDLSLVGVLSRLEMKMTLPEVLSAYTVGAACALNHQKVLGSVEVGKKCDFAVLEGSWRDLFYQVGHHPVAQTYKDGQRIFLKKS
ncbi:MAG: imidazolonepropionase [Bdellovibrionales bacterium]|nr:imidazolonepropionase [Bdellovibrionales bacterium]